MAKSSPAWSSAFEAQEGQELTSRLAVRPPVSGLGSNATSVPKTFEACDSALRAGDSPLPVASQMAVLDVSGPLLRKPVQTCSLGGHPNK
jgi:hypothetical protein